jgi:hypothetical protein
MSKEEGVSLSTEDDEMGHERLRLNAIAEKLQSLTARQ